MLTHIVPSNYITTYEEYDFLAKDIRKTIYNGNEVFVCDRNNNSKRLEMVFEELKENPLTNLPLKEVKVRIPIRLGYAYSVVVNAIRGEPYAAIASRKFCPTCGRDEDTGVGDRGSADCRGAQFRP